MGNYAGFFFFAIFLLTPIGKYPVVFPTNDTPDQLSAIFVQISSILQIVIQNGYGALVGSAGSTGISKRLADLAGYCHRIGELLEVFDELDKEQQYYEKMKQLEMVGKLYLYLL